MSRPQCLDSAPAAQGLGCTGGEGACPAAPTTERRGNNSLAYYFFFLTKCLNPFLFVLLFLNFWALETGPLPDEHGSESRGVKGKADVTGLVRLHPELREKPWV